MRKTERKEEERFSCLPSFLKRISWFCAFVIRFGSSAFRYCNRKSQKGIASPNSTEPVDVPGGLCHVTASRSCSSLDGWILDNLRQLGERAIRRRRLEL